MNKALAEFKKRYDKWKDIVEISGPAWLKLYRGFRDEAMRGKRKEFRSFLLNQQYRVNDQIGGDQLKVYVVEVTPHDYRRKS